MLPPRLFSRRSRTAFARVLLVSAMVQGALTAAEAPAQAWVRQRSKAFAPYFWRDPRQVIEVSRPAPETEVTEKQLRAASEAAVRAWSDESISCTSVNLTLAPETSDDGVAKRDERNRITMRVGAWCRDPLHPTAKTCHDPDAIALTTLFTVVHPGFPDDGRILEGDIELNAVNWTWATLPDPPTGDQNNFNKFDLIGALTHETGHFIGLDHTCTVVGTTALIDDQGRPVPNCNAIPVEQSAQITDATMYPSIDMGSIAWRTLTDDETSAACAIYPVSALPLDEWGGMGGCTTAASSPPHGAQGLVVVILGVVSLLLAGLLARVFRARTIVAKRVRRPWNSRHFRADSRGVEGFR